MVNLFNDPYQGVKIVKWGSQDIYWFVYMLNVKYALDLLILVFALTYGTSYLRRLTLLELIIDLCIGQMRCYRTTRCISWFISSENVIVCVIHSDQVISTLIVSFAQQSLFRSSCGRHDVQLCTCSVNDVQLQDAHRRPLRLKASTSGTAYGPAEPVSDPLPGVSSSLTSSSLPVVPQDAAAGRRHLLPAAGAGHRGQGRPGRLGRRGAHGGRRAAVCDAGLHPGSVPGGAGGVRGAQRVAGQPGPHPHHLCVKKSRRRRSTPWWHPTVTTDPF